MSDDLYRCRSLVYLHRVPLDHVEASLSRYQPYTGRKRRVTLGVGDELDGWRPVGVADELDDITFLELAWALFGGDDAEDFDLEKLAGELDVPDDAVIAVRLGPSPSETWYALAEPNDRFDVLFAGRREDGDGFRIDLVEDSVKEMKKPLHDSSLDVYLRGRGVPAPLLPTPGGFAFAAARRVGVTVNVE